ncbi:BREX system serine/threonine kinase PglW [Kribbella qitaiheensis]|uniref:BREX system serine/threonine kinase PglW n=1 Tax=Kribbella qitaiheensis TaxID=1544730 RepID=UPI003606D6C2
MRVDSPRWVEVSQSEFAHEREGLAQIRDLLPDRGPFRAWTNFEFRDGQGRWHEVDALVLGERRLHLVELKHYRGRITGNSYRWQRNGRTEDSPLPLTRRKAQRLKSVIVDALRELAPTLNPREAVPFIQECIYLHAADGSCGLAHADAADLFGPDGNERTSLLPSIADRLLEPRNSAQRPKLIDNDDLVAALFEKIGFAQRREPEVGSWRLVGPAETEGDDWQDWPAEHARIRDQHARIRFFVSEPGASDASRRAKAQLVEREFALTSKLSHHGLLTPRDLVENEVGAGLVFDRKESARRLDLWLADRPHGLPLEEQVGIIRQLAEAMAYAHRQGIVHRGLTPAAVMVFPDEPNGAAPTVRVGGWQLVGADRGTGTDGAAGSATRLHRILEDRRVPDAEQQRMEVYLAPEGRFDVGAERVRLDVFGLGALAYLLASGQPPAQSVTDLRQRLRENGALDISADVTGAPPELRQLIRSATAAAVSERSEDMNAVLTDLDRLDRVLLGRDQAVATQLDPLDAVPGDVLAERFEVVRRLGSGSTAVGLLVKDRDADEELRVLKVAINDKAQARLADELEVLRALRAKPHTRIVRLLHNELLTFGKRSALLLESAGEETLADALHERPRLSLDLLQRWGTDLLEALVALDRIGIDHRDVKPANLGVREQRGERKKHLVLFDFSLSRAGAASTQAGTPPYLDPFLGEVGRPTWDSAAERYAAAVTLFEMATGRSPVFGDGQSDPTVTGDEAAVDPGMFDPAVAGALTTFFQRALKASARERFHTASEMLVEWRAALSDPITTVIDNADEVADAVTPETLLSQSGLSPRALSAVEPLGLQTVGDLARVDPGRLSRLKGAASPTRLEVRRRAKQWRERFGDDLRLAELQTAPPADVVASAQRLAAIAGKPRSTKRRAVAESLLGVGASLTVPDPFATLAGLISGLGFKDQPQLSVMLGQIQEQWASDDEAIAILSSALADAVAVLRSIGGVASAHDLAQRMAAGDLDSAVASADTVRITAGLLRVALDRAELVVRGDGDPAPITRMRRRSADRAVLVATDPSLFDLAPRLGEIADSLVAELSETSSVVPASYATARIRDAWPGDLELPDEITLTRLAARWSQRAGASRRGELHDRHLPHERAVAVALGGVSVSQQLTPQTIQEQVRARFPDLQPVPGRPDLDRIIQRAGLPLEWSRADEAYVAPSRGPLSTGFHSRSTSLAPHAVEGPVNGLEPEYRRLDESIRTRSFSAIAVPPGDLDGFRNDLVERYTATVVDVTEVLVAELHRQAKAVSIAWADVQAADAAEPGTTASQGLAMLVRRAIPAVEAAIASAQEAEPAGLRPVLLTEAAPLATYGHSDVLARLADLTTAHRQAVWLLLPYDESMAVDLDGRALPLAHTGQVLRMVRRHRASTQSKGTAS